MQIATWNINSLRVRLPHVLRWLESQRPDVLALQETKLPDPDFPAEEFTRLGYHAAFSGQPAYNGVALLARVPLTVVATALPDFDDAQKRVLFAHMGEIHILNLYVPNGQSLDSDKYQYKLQWLKQLNRWLTQLLREHPQLVVLGDFNIAPEDRDVHDPKAWEGGVLVSAAERAAFRSLLEQGLQDSFRLLHQEGGHYSWWDYRAAAFRRNLGLRIDHILLSPALAGRCLGAHMDREPRGWERPSDHVPVITML
ncbi:MAG: exodeoxyribonuclease III [Gammaproteobacteria bacterium]